MSSQQTLFDLKKYEDADLIKIKTEHCHPHPLDPRMFFNEEQIERLSEQIRKYGYKPEYAIHVRLRKDKSKPDSPYYEILGGRHRIKACKKTNTDTLYAWDFKNISDERAHSMLLLDNEQTELTAIEKGKHAYEHIDSFDEKGGRSKTGGLRGYARQHGDLSIASVSEWVGAYEVVKNCSQCEQFRNMSHRLLYEISKSSQSAWRPLVEIALDEDWTIKETKTVVKKIQPLKSLQEYDYDMPDIYQRAAKSKAEKVSQYKKVVEAIKHWFDFLEEKQELYEWKETGETRKTGHQVEKQLLAEAYDYFPQEVFRDYLVGDTPLTTTTINRHANQILSHIQEHSEGGERWKPQLSEEEIARLEAIDEEKAIRNHIDLRVEHVSSMDVIGENSVDLIIADPPYNIADIGKISKKHGEMTNFDFITWDIQDSQEYLGFLWNALNEFNRVLKDNGSFYIFVDKPMISYIWSMTTEIGMQPKNIVVWKKTNPVPQGRKNNFLSATEFILWGVKSSDYTFNFTDENDMHNLIETPICAGEERTEHPTQKPVELIKKLILLSSDEGDLVLDPYAGSGTTGEAAILTERDYRLLEKEPDYIQIIKERLYATVTRGSHLEG